MQGRLLTYYNYSLYRHCERSEAIQEAFHQSSIVHPAQPLGVDGLDRVVRFRCARRSS